MEVIHDTGSLSIRKNTEDNSGFLLTNKNGSYCSFFNVPNSRYYGLFYFELKTMSMYKFIEHIEPIGCSEAIRLKNGFYFAERWKGNIAESFLMPRNINSLLYELSRENEIDLFLDCKNSYDNREWGRNYEIFEEKGCLIVKFTKKTDKREDLSSGMEEFVLYMAIKSNGADSSHYQKNDKWIERKYSADEERNSPPFKRHVYNALRLKGSRFVFSMSKNKFNAIKECADAFNKFDNLKIQENYAFLEFLKNDSIKRITRNWKINSEIKTAYICALNSLNNLIIPSKNSFGIFTGTKGIFAGLPWFFQFWTRDTLISLKTLSKIIDSMPIIFDYLNKINNDGRLLGGADSHGWLFFRCNEIIKKDDECPKIEFEIKNSLEKSLSGLVKSHTRDNFEINDAKETWMDTEFDGDGRKGARIEIQALRLNMYKLMHRLSQNHKYNTLENILKIKVRQRFFDGKIVADGIDDFTIRPNMFIAAYTYPEFLSDKEWETCFENTLKNLWLDWGGLSSIDKSSRFYTDVHTGEYVKSYHRGDSWFWINNLAASVLNRINKNKFSNQINKIVEAGTEEILWRNCIGCHSELSSARELSSKGCFAQAWSNAMYVEMIDEVY